jgi:hypothetical protein
MDGGCMEQLSQQNGGGLNLRPHLKFRLLRKERVQNPHVSGCMEQHRAGWAEDTSGAEQQYTE